MLSRSGLPKTFWYKAYEHANYITDRMPTRTWKGYMSPIECLTGKVPDVSMLRVWGCKVWSLIPKTEDGKDFSEKGYQGFYMGVSEQPIGYKIFVPALNQQVVTVHCIFDENIPSRDEEYFAEIDQLFKLKIRNPKDFNYLIGLHHQDDEDGLIYETTRVAVRKGIIVAYRRMVCSDVTTREEKTPIHIQEVANLAARWILKNPVICDVDTHESVRKNLEEVSQGEETNEVHLQDISMILCEDNAVEPMTLKEAKQLPERDHWIRGARQELKKLEKRKCWKVVRTPKHRKMIKSKLVFKLKRDHLGKISKFKVRLVAKDFFSGRGS